MFKSDIYGEKNNDTTRYGRPIWSDNSQKDYTTEELPIKRGIYYFIIATFAIFTGKLRGKLYQSCIAEKEEQMKVLIVYCHPSTNSFTHNVYENFVP